MIKASIVPAILALVMASCATTPATNGDGSSAADPVDQTALDRTGDGLGDAASAPLTDLNLKRKKIPDLLKTIRNPYNVDTNISCEEIAVRVEALTDILGRDWDIPPPDKKSLDERAADGASTAFLDSVASGASGLIPFRSVVRTVTGANYYQRKVLKAYERGSHRRTFLKGLGLMKDCPVPAAPAPLEDLESKIVFK